jgi:hypothetical protein
MRASDAIDPQLPFAPDKTSLMDGNEISYPSIAGQVCYTARGRCNLPYFSNAATLIVASIPARTICSMSN